jgi:hypothetical protein
MKLTNAKQLEGRALHARDGTVGNVRDFYFDDHSWKIRYCEVETGEWLRSRKVLISPEVFRAYDWAQKSFPVDLSIDEVRNSPDVDTDKPVSRQHEEELRRYYGWPPYWNVALADGGIMPAMALPLPVDMDADLEFREPHGDPRLRSVNDTVGYSIEAVDGPIGHAHDFLIDTENWRVRYVVIDTRNWWPGKKVIVAPAWIEHVSWETSQMVVDLTRDLIKGSPEYDPSAAWDPAYGEKLHDYFRHSRHYARGEVLASVRSHRQ